MEDEEVLQNLEQTTKFDSDRYDVGLLWKPNDPILPIKYSSALSQIKSLEYSIEKKPELMKLTKTPSKLMSKRNWSES